MPAKKIAASPAVIPASAGRVVPSAPTVVIPSVPGSSAALAPSVLEVVPEVGRLGSEPLDPEAIAFAEAQAIAVSEAQARVERVAALVKAGIASKLAERDRLAALEKANREAVYESSEINTAIEAV